MTIDKDKSEKISKKIQLLLNRTTENGCTESEALVAAEKAQQLLNDYNLSMTEVQYRASEFDTVNITTQSSRRSDIHFLVGSIAEFTGSKCWISRGVKVTYNFFGEKKATEMASFLYDLLGNAIKYESEKFKKSEDYLSRRKCKANPWGVAGVTLNKSFKTGMVHSLNNRLDDMTREQEINNEEAYGIVIYNKMDIVEAKFDEIHNIKLGSDKSKSSNIDYSTYCNGQDAGDKVVITTGLKSKDKQTLRLN